MMKLVTYFRSSASYRVRIALNYKGLAYEPELVHLLRDGGEQKKPEYLAKNPAGLVPLLTLDDGNTIAQSVAMLEYLEEAFPRAPALLPSAPLDRAYVRSLVNSIACDLHPLNNLRVLKRLETQFNADADAKKAWYRHWCELVLSGLEQTVALHGKSGAYCLGDTVTLADVCLVPQWANAERFEVNTQAFPTLDAIVARLRALPAFIAAAPANQPDAE